MSRQRSTSFCKIAAGRKLPSAIRMALVYADGISVRPFHQLHFSPTSGNSSTSMGRSSTVSDKAYVWRVMVSEEKSVETAATNCRYHSARRSMRDPGSSFSTTAPTNSSWPGLYSCAAAASFTMVVSRRTSASCRSCSDNAEREIGTTLSDRNQDTPTDYVPSAASIPVVRVDRFASRRFKATTGPANTVFGVWTLLVGRVGYRDSLHQYRADGNTHPHQDPVTNATQAGETLILNSITYS